MFRETRDAVHGNSLLLLTSSNGRKIDPSRFHLRHKSARVEELEAYLLKNDQIEPIWVEGQASGSDSIVLLQLQNNEMNEVAEMLTLAVKADPRIPATNFQDGRMPLLKAVLAALVNFHPEKD